MDDTAEGAGQGHGAWVPEAQGSGSLALPCVGLVETVEEIVAQDGSDTETGEALTARAARKAPRSPQEPVEKKTARDLFEYVIEQGRRDYQVQRYKGLGEMTAPQLWETTMDPERRTLLSVKLEDLAATEEIFTTLMGEDVESRRKFIEENALDVRNLDI